MSHSIHATHTNKYLIAILVLLVIPISGLSIDIYVPSLPAVAKFFHVDKSLAQLSITTYMLGMGVMQLFSGGVSDAYGRRKPFLVAVSIYILATIGILFTSSIYALLTLRMVQGISVALMVVPLRSVIPDLFEGKEMMKMMTYMTTAWSIGPIIAPAIGGYLQEYFGWKANFYFLISYSALSMLILYFFLPETSKHRHAFHLPSLFNRYKNMLKNADYVSGLLINSMLYSTLILFSVVAPFLIQNVLHYSPSEFGHIALLVGLAWFLGTINNRLLINVEHELKVKLCFTLMLIIACIMLFLSILNAPTLYNIVVPVFFLALLGGSVFPNYFAHAVTLFPKSTGSANALFGALLFMISGIASSLGTVLLSVTIMPLALSYVVMIMISLAIFFTRNRYSAMSSLKSA